MTSPRAKHRQNGPAETKPQINRVTVFSDASFCARTKAAGWGCWVKGDKRASITDGGPLTAPMRTSTDAEAAALANALWTARKYGFLTPDTLVMLQSDCSGVLNYVLRTFPEARDNPVAPTVGLSKAQAKKQKPVRCVATKKDPEPGSPIEAAMRTLKEIVEATGIVLEVRHVRGHKGQLGGRYGVNDLCDRTARKAMNSVKHGVSA